MGGIRSTYSGLEASDFIVGECVGLGDDGNQVDLGMEAAHNFNVQRLQGVASGLDEVNTGVDTVVHNVHPVDLVLGIQVGVVSLLNVVDNRSPRLVIVHKVTETGRVNNGQAKTDAGFLDISADRLDLDGLGDDIQAGALALSGGVKRCVEQGVDERRFAQARFTY